MSLNLLTTDAAKNVLKQLSELKESKDYNQTVWEIFLGLVETPRPSYHHTAVVEFCKKFAADHKLECRVDEADNVCITIPATPGYENVPVIGLQGHSDIVGVAESGFTHNFKTDPLVPRIHDMEGEKWVSATNTSLGADNGIAVAAGLAIALEKDLKHGPLELLITSDEEVGLLGAAALKDGFIKSVFVLNLDSEEELAICVGCAGGFVNHFHLPITREAHKGELVGMKLWNLTGGHTGVDIPLGRGNALLLSARILKACLPEGGRVVAVNGGQAHNAVPREIVSTVSLPAGTKAEFVKKVEALVDVIREEFRKTDPEIKLDWVDAEKMTPMSAESTAKFLNFALQLPFRVYRMSQAVDDLVQTSYAITISESKETEVVFTGSARSDSKDQLDAVYNELCGLCALAGVAAPEREDEYPGWPANADSYLLKVAEKKHVDVVGKKAAVYAIHAGLECGLLLSNCPCVRDAVSIGPEIRSPHSPSERLMIRTVGPFYEFVKATIETIAEEKK
ncbi:Aminoacyl-histidine dipeptidase [Carpediemonas membranifera]|uniref:Aminoacyl-histidine dipeptidase n=1 Tax=Carpediemonas membranifera TaxID=201153 RepID=A0A8J6AVV7_9EUKA|nr:Aminoacyl-histidine dipeptidase [Carpediemonas membranifera]|eukprot:KAG9396091.1 Aminoacyl-histidine dipeptidase [Carpediemonas membranifera]